MRKSRFSLILLVPMLLFSCLESSKKELSHDVLDDLHESDRIIFKKYYSLGKTLYRDRCQNCHGKNGEGLGKLIPPLADADFIKNSPELLPCIIKHGLSGPLVVNGITYNQLMPANKTLRPLELAELITYIGSSWGNNTGLTSISMVNKALSDCE